MRIVLATVQDAAKKGSPLATLVTEYTDRTQRMFPCTVQHFRSTAALLAMRDEPATSLILLDPRGKAITSEAFATLLGGLRDGGKRTAVLAIGPADGWTDTDRSCADHLLSIGIMTLPHQLAAVVLAEQIYRAATILARHPYHLGH